jgi:alpha-beta hydrolase superfamily lysophospholipase
MPDYEITALRPADFDEQPVLNTYFHHKQPAACLAVLFPGQSYTCDMPLLYYTTEVMLAQGIDVLQLYRDRQEAEGGSGQDQIRTLISNARALVTAGQRHQEYQQLILVGKSLGTLVMAALVTSTPGIATALTIWQTPLLKQSIVVEGALRYRSPALILASTSDSTYDADAAKRLQTTSGARLVLFQDANHSLEYPGDLPRSLETMQQVVKATAEFLGENIRPS